MKKKLFITLILTIVAAVSALGFVGCGNVPNGNGNAIEKPSDKEEPPFDDKEEEKRDEGKKEDKDEDNEGGKGDEKSDNENAPSYEDPLEDGGWTGWQKDKK